MALATEPFADLVTLTRASTATRFNSSGVMATAAVDARRIDHNPGASNAPRGILIEPQRTNLLTYSQDLANAAWTKLNATAAKNQPDLTGGANLASRLTSDNTGANGQFRASQSLTISGTNAPYWAVLKAGTVTNVRISTASFTTNVTGNFDLTNGVVLSGSDASARIESLGSGRWLCSILIPVGADPSGMVLINGLTAGGSTTFAPLDGTQTFDILATQVESGDFPTSYIPTAASQVTRSADLAFVGGTAFSDAYGTSAGTCVVTFRTRGALTDRRAADLSNGSDSDRITLSQNGSAQLVVDVRDVATSQASLNLGTVADYAATQKVAFAWSGNDFAACLNGGTVATDASGTVPTLDRLHIGAAFGGGNQFAGWIESIQFGRERLSNTRLQELTA